MPAAKEMKNDLEFNPLAPNVTGTCHAVRCWACQISGTGDSHALASLCSSPVNSNLWHM